MSTHHKPPQPTTLHVRAVPPHLKTQFKAYCARRGYSMQNCIIALMAKTLREDKPIPEARNKRRTGS